jgi:hypothetical protein
MLASIAALAAAAAAFAAWALPRRARRILDQAEAALDRIDASLHPYLDAHAYIPERLRRPAHEEVARIFGSRFLRFSPRAKRVDRRCRTLREILERHNDLFVERAIRAGEELLVGRLGLDRAQQEAVVRDDARNLVVAGAGSGKTRTIVARILHLLATGVAPEAILAVTFTTKAAGEMRERLAAMGVSIDGRGRPGVTVSTLHALGRRVLLGGAPFAMADDEWARACVGGLVRAARTGEDPELARLYLHALTHIHRIDEPGPDGAPNRTLRGETVPTEAERISADLLHVHDVAYRIEPEGVRLAEADLRVEPGPFDASVETRLVERLARAGVPLRPRPIRAAERDAPDFACAVEGLLGQFVANARSLQLGPAAVVERVGRASPRVIHFALLAAEALRRYEASLAAEGRIDFADMLHRAAEALRGGAPGLPPFRHVLVDEFQDTSAAMAALLRAILARSDARLFAVGDDWQAIYGFAGGDVDHIVNFETHFGVASKTLLATNYRSPAAVVEAGAAIMARNERQIPKRVEVHARERGEAYVHEAPEDDEGHLRYAFDLLRSELDRCNPGDILVVSRTNHPLEALARMCREGGVPSAVRLMSAHKAKGVEAAVVIVLNASDHLFGFPSKVETSDLLAPVRMSGGEGDAEERRLFYVAVTRTMKRLHLVARAGRPSPYIAEIEGDDAADDGRWRQGARVEGEFTIQWLFAVSKRQAGAGIRQAGVLARGELRVRFASWARFDLEEGATYAVEGARVGRPYQGRACVKLDRSTRVRLVSRGAGGPPPNRVRELRPRPPPSHAPRPTTGSPAADPGPPRAASSRPPCGPPCRTRGS